MVAVAKLSTEEARQHEGLVHRSRHQAFTEMFDLFSKWEPWRQAFFINQGPNLATIAGAVPGLILYRRHFRRILPGLRTLMDRTSGNVRVVFGSNYPSLVSALVPASVCGFSHLYLVTADIALQETPCSVCVETRATALQVILGAWLPFASSLLGFVMVGRGHHLKWIPSSRAGWGAWLSLYKDLLSKSQNILVVATVAQMLVAGALVYAETSSYWSIMKELDRRVKEDEEREARRRGDIASLQ